MTEADAAREAGVPSIDDVDLDEADLRLHGGDLLVETERATYQFHRTRASSSGAYSLDLSRDHVAVHDGRIIVHPMINNHYDEEAEFTHRATSEKFERQTTDEEGR